MDPRLADLEAAVHAAGKRMTGAKRAVAEVLVRAEGHLSAEEITARVQGLREVGASTVYRVLEEFEELGLVVHTHLGAAAAVFHLVGVAHGHLVCDNCGATIEVPASTFDGLGRVLLRRYGFLLDRHHVALSGLCRHCAKRTSEGGPEAH